MDNMAQTLPLKLYKYQTYNEYSLENLKNHSLWYSDPAKFNDPFDSDININFIGITSRFLKAHFKLARETAPDKQAFDAKYLTLGQINRNFRNRWVKGMTLLTNKKRLDVKVGVTCFSEINDSILMWSHYANGHQGFCLEFHTENFLSWRSNRLRIDKVDYPKSNSYPSAGPVDLNMNFYYEFTPQVLKTLYGTKSFHWAYEKEWRAISKSADTLIPYDPKTLTGVYLGCKMQTEHKKTIASILVGTPTTLFQMAKSDIEFSLIHRESEYMT